jgi:SAM-dependent methyltransferase
MKTATEHPLIEKLGLALNAGTLVKLTLSQPTTLAEAELRNIYGRQVEVRGSVMISLLYRYARRDITRNLPAPEAMDMLREKLGTDFARAHLLTTSGDWQWRMDRPQELKASRPSCTVSPSLAHDRAKSHVVGSESAFLRALGVTNASGDPRPGMAGKLRQIQRFVEILAPLFDGSELRERRDLRVLDMGAGKGYLTFAAYHFLKSRGIAAAVTGVEARAELVEFTNKAARELGFDGLHFVQGSIGDFQQGTPADVLIALHACNTATDDSLFHGIQIGAGLLLVAPCCHQELRPQLAPAGVLQPVHRHGILQEREAEIVTDAIRALLLEVHGYAASVFEFIAPEHTGKNLMISAQRRPHTAEPAQRLRQLQELLAFYGIREQRLARLLGHL